MLVPDYARVDYDEGSIIRVELPVNTQESTMGVLASTEDDARHIPHTPSSDAIKKRNVHPHHVQFSAAEQDQDVKKGANLTEDDEIEATIRSLPSWQDQLSLRGYIVGMIPRKVRLHMAVQRNKRNKRNKA